MTSQQISGQKFNVFKNCVSLLCTLGLLPIIALIFTWVFKVESSPSIAVLQSAMGYFLAVAYPVFIFAVIAKRKVLGVLAAIVAMTHVFMYSDEFKTATSLPASAKSAPHFTVLDHNIRFDNENPLLEVAEIKKVNPDIVFLEELTEPTYELLDENGAFSAYPYHSLYIHQDHGPKGLGLFSKYPLKDPQQIVQDGFPQQRAIVTIANRDITLWNIHAQSPVNGDIVHWKNDLAMIKERLHAEPGDVIAAGDFNSTWSHIPFREIVGDGYREAEIDRGHGYARTWPVDRSLGQQLKGFIRIDHVLSRGKVRPTSIHEVSGAGSDHRGVVTTFAILP